MTEQSGNEDGSYFNIRIDFKFYEDFDWIRLRVIRDLRKMADEIEEEKYPYDQWRKIFEIKAAEWRESAEEISS
jgi:hypothetical protein